MTSTQTKTTKRTVCFTCGQQCGHIAYLQEGRVVKLIGDREHPRTQGFICPKGARSDEINYSADRIHYPMKRRGPRGSNKWEQISWDQALDEIASSLGKIATEHGPEAVAYGFGTIRSADYAIGKRFMNIFGSPNSIGQERICAGPNIYGEFLTYGAATFPIAAAGVTDTIVLWGGRPNESARPTWKRTAMAIEAGAQLIVIDPEQTKEAMDADLWLQIKPGTDAALGLGLIHQLISQNIYDKEFVLQDTRGFDALAARANEYTSSRVSEITGVPETQLEQAAKLLCATRTTAIVAGNGLCQSGSNAVQNGRTIACLIALSGNLNRTGGHQAFGPPKDLLSNEDWHATHTISDQQLQKALGAETFPSMGLGYKQLDKLVSRAWHGKQGYTSATSGAHEPTLWNAISNGQPYPVKALILQSHNPVGGSANVEQVEIALKSNNLSLLVVHDLFVNATSVLADYLLPAAHWFEKPYLSLGVGNLGVLGDFIEVKHALIDPAYEHRSDYDFWCDLGHRMGQEDYWPPSAEDFFQTVLDPAELNFDELATHNGPIMGELAQNQNTQLQPSESRYGTSSGKVEFACELLEQWGHDPLPLFSWPAIFKSGEDFPLLLVTGGRQIEGFHQNAQQSSVFRKKNPDPYLTAHPKLATELKLCEGSWVSIETPVGSVQQILRLSEKMRPNVVHADRWWYPEGTNIPDDIFGVRKTGINFCTSNAPGDLDPIFGSWLLRGIPCRLKNNLK